MEVTKTLAQYAVNSQYDDIPKDEFKSEAVNLVKDRGASVAQAARDLDVHENVLRKWVKELAADNYIAGSGSGQSRGIW